MSRPVALVSGGSRGIGRAVVVRLARDGYDVAFCHRARTDAAAEVAEEARAAGARVLTRTVDVADAGAVRGFVAAAHDELGPARAVVTAAGIARNKPLALMADAEWQEVVRANLDGTYHLCHSAVGTLIKQPGAAVVTLSSIAGLQGGVGQANYAASKAGIIGFTRSLAKEYGRFKLRANSVAPGVILTDMTAALPERARAAHRSRIPLREFGTAEDVADLVSFLLSDAARYITGQVIGVDGGLTL